MAGAGAAHRATPRSSASPARPGVGKSTSTVALVTALRKAGKRVGVLAVDPSSPFSGGALLGDRVRMQDHATDREVYIRSMASRGHLGGLAWATPQALRVLDAAGCDVVLVETVGVGPVRGRDRRAGRHHAGAAGPGHGRRHPGGEGRHPRDRRPLRRQQGRPGRRRPGPPRPARHARRWPSEPRAPGGRRSSRPSPRRARASTRWSRRSTSTAPGSSRRASSPRRRTRRARDEIEAIAVTALRARWGDVHGRSRARRPRPAGRAGESDPYAAADELLEDLYGRPCSAGRASRRCAV